jgi:hypothetical protein
MIVQTDDDVEKKMFQFVSGVYMYEFMDIYIYIYNLVIGILIRRVRILYMCMYMCIDIYIYT